MKKSIMFLAVTAIALAGHVAAQTIDARSADRYLPSATLSFAQTFAPIMVLPAGTATKDGRRLAEEVTVSPQAGHVRVRFTDGSEERWTVMICGGEGGSFGTTAYKEGEPAECPPGLKPVK